MLSISNALLYPAPRPLCVASHICDIHHLGLPAHKPRRVFHDKLFLTLGDNAPWRLGIRNINIEPTSGPDTSLYLVVIRAEIALWLVWLRRQMVPLYQFYPQPWFGLTQSDEVSGSRTSPGTGSGQCTLMEMKFSGEYLFTISRLFSKPVLLHTLCDFIIADERQRDDNHVWVPDLEKDPYGDGTPEGNTPDVAAHIILTPTKQLVRKSRRLERGSNHRLPALETDTLNGVKRHAPRIL
ncbi:hypothetical protein EGW08_021987 [Elysia chlorotica]|uniref:Uncharacterized protein n=1 Tax=Elysia chlorotica TaxID=188477 RepID=A0A433SM49_ELYCH|nr:hypothetical protein EGW08_021987 [Elysia chlorotica]